MHPTLFTIGTLNVSTYTVLLDLGLILGLVLAYFEGKRWLDDGGIALDLGLWAIIGGIVGGRLGFVLANWRIFSEDWLRALRIWEGGLSFHGAFLGGLLTLFLFTRLHRRDGKPVSFWEMGDVLTPGLALGITFGWAACLMGGCAYGALGQGFGYAVLPDLYGVEAYRFATQALGLGFSLVLFLGIWLLRGHWPFAGAAFSMYSLLYFAGQFFLEFTRGDEAVYLGLWRLPQLLDLGLALVAAAALLVLWWQAGRAPEADDEEGEEPAEPPEEAGEAKTGPASPPGEAEESPAPTEKPAPADDADTEVG